MSDPAAAHLTRRILTLAVPLAHRLDENDDLIRQEVAEMLSGPDPVAAAEKAWHVIASLATFGAEQLLLRCHAEGLDPYQVIRHYDFTREDDS